MLPCMLEHIDPKLVFALLSAEDESSLLLPPDPAGLFSEGGEVIRHHIEDSLTMHTAGI